jgi:archaemetzincin
MSLAEIILFPIGELGEVETAVVELLALSLSEHVNLRSRLSDIGISLEGSYDVARRQYYSTRLLERLLDHRADDDGKLLGIAGVDLYIPPLSFVFGEAQLGGDAAVISTHRLDQRFYGLERDVELLYSRCEKEAVHEIGHCFGLVHCRDYRCVMYLSYAVEDIDLKSNVFCPACRELLPPGP